MPESKGLIAGLYIQNPFWLKQLQETIFTWYIIFTLCKYLFLFRAERVSPWVACGIEFYFFFFLGVYSGYQALLPAVGVGVVVVVMANKASRRRQDA